MCFGKVILCINLHITYVRFVCVSVWISLKLKDFVLPSLVIIYFLCMCGLWKNVAGNSPCDGLCWLVAEV